VKRCDDSWIQFFSVPAEKPSQVLNQCGGAQRASKQVQGGGARVEVHLDDDLPWLGWQCCSHKEPGKAMQLTMRHAAQRLLVGGTPAAGQTPAVVRAASDVVSVSPERCLHKKRHSLYLVTAGSPE
jgi:hypothetical protein